MNKDAFLHLRMENKGLCVEPYCLNEATKSRFFKDNPDLTEKDVQFHYDNAGLIYGYTLMEWYDADLFRKTSANEFGKKCSKRFTSDK